MSRVQEVRDRIGEIETVFRKHEIEKFALENELLELKFDVLTSTSALVESDWRTMYSSDDGLVLFSDVERHTKLADLFETDYHCGVDMRGLQISFSDGDISLAFSDIQYALEFIKKHNLKIDLKEIKREIRKSIERAEKLTDFVNMIGQ